ncbi:hypothetical protein [Aureibacillus halotolerans]|uniref:Uncharacterized protein n=1 Tax=Aureibacillus halotolerans TaxID=1508390 RepID=A0A4R6TZ40_9BACI|nr:hypothetical protein [Aureibacillus halotolerans]TDQ39240.1 hypothetical protein EV213_108192 [Aureibacillus halotolerans]
MIHSFEVYSPSGIEIKEYDTSKTKEQCVTEIVDSLKSVKWYRIRYHLCHNEEQKPCDPWQLEHEHGNIPDPEII